MPRASFSRTTFLVGASLAGALAALPAVLQGCALLTCFPGDPGCDGAGGSSAGAGGGGVASSTSTGGAGGAGGTGGAGGGPGCGECWGGECVDGECQPILVDLPLGYTAGRIAATKDYLYVIATQPNARAPLVVMQIGVTGFQQAGAALQPEQYTLVDTGIPVVGESAFLAARGEDVYVAPQIAKGILHCAFTSIPGCEAIAAAEGEPYNGLVLGKAPELADAYLFAVKGQSASLGVTRFLAVDPFTKTGETLAPPASPPTVDGSHHLAVGPDGRLAWSLYGPLGCVAVGRPGDMGATACPSACLLPKPVQNATGVAVDKDHQVFFVATDGVEYSLYRTLVTDLDGCGYQESTEHRALGLPLLSQGVAVDDDHVYAVAKDPAGGSALAQVILRCSRNGLEDCVPIVDFLLPSPGAASVAATPDGVFFATGTQVGWKHR